MNKQEFLKALKKELSSLKRQERAEQLRFYSEMIDDKMEEGLTEAEATASIGHPAAIAKEIFDEEKTDARGAKEKRKLRACEILVLVLGSPLWVSLLIAFLAVGIALFAVLWVLVAVGFAVAIPFALLGFLGKYMLIGCKAMGKFAFTVSQKTVVFVARFFGNEGK